MSNRNQDTNQHKRSDEVLGVGAWMDSGKWMNKLEDFIHGGTEINKTEEELSVGAWMDASKWMTKLKDYTESLENLVEQRTLELEALNKELEAFSYSVSHDLRAPLRSINGFSQALLEDYADFLDDEGKMYLERMRAASQRMGELIQELLELSKVSRSEMNREPVDLSEIAQTVGAELQETQPERRVDFIITPRLDADCDAGLIRLVLENLLGNAWKFTGKKPLARIEFGATKHEEENVYFVRDNGAGFDMEFADKLFGAFQRLHSPDEFSGIGIGLATVKRIIHRHGGRVWAEGEVGKGATFYFTL
jgi:light-regulated signal transduction histidine kinase (bacteriophytochrome)